MVETGIRNGSSLRLVMPFAMYKAFLEKINNYDVNLRSGLREYLRLGGFSSIDPEKHVLIEREIGNDRSGQVYGSMICDIVQEIAGEMQMDLESYELVLPMKRTGGYLSKRYNHHNVDSAIFMESLNSTLDFDG